MTESKILIERVERTMATLEGSVVVIIEIIVDVEELAWGLFKSSRGFEVSFFVAGGSFDACM